MEISLNKFFWNHRQSQKGINWMRWVGDWLMIPYRCALESFLPSPSNPFLNAKDKENSSYKWKSFLKGQKVLILKLELRLEDWFRRWKNNGSISIELAEPWTTNLMVRRTVWCTILCFRTSQKQWNVSSFGNCLQINLPNHPYL